MELWTFAFRHVITKRNNTPRPDLSFKIPEEVFNGMERIEEPSEFFQDFHLFGCLVYVLHKKLQDGKTVKKWEPRAHVGVYLRQSRKHV